MSELIFTHSNSKEAVNLKEDRSFASKKVDILRKVTFKQQISPASKIIFIHLAQTGGTGMYFLTQALEKTQQVNLKGERCSVPENPAVCPNIVTEGYIGGLPTAREYLQQSSTYFDQFNFISGHLPYGLHELGEGEIKDAKYITLIRDPRGLLGREIAAINFAYQRGYIKTKNDAIQLLMTSLNNSQTRMLAGEKYVTGPCTEETLQKAKENIEKHFMLVAVTENTNSFIEILASIQGWGNLALPRTQVSGDKIFAKEEDLSADLRTYIDESNKFDIALYEWAKVRWENWTKLYVSSTEDIKADETVLCILPDYASTRTPYLVARQSIDEYNKQTDGTELLETEQIWREPETITTKFKM